MGTEKNVFLFLTDKDSDTVLSNLSNLQEGTKPYGTYVLFHQKDDIIPEPFKNEQTHLFSNKSVGEMGYLPISKDLVPGSNHFPVLKFFREYPVYEFYWLIEDDVWFNGNWNHFFSFFQSYDHHFMSSHIRFHRQEPEWVWWRSLSHPFSSIPVEERLRSFNPIYRISRPALEFLHNSLSDYWIGHHEVLMPTLLYHNGFSIGDFGGDGEFVLEGNNNRFYTSGNLTDMEGRLSDGTMRYRPSWDKKGMEKNMLYHPVKGALYTI
jgi:hypothetical protein